MFAHSVYLRKILTFLFPEILDPPTCTFEITSYCNAKCVFCSYPKIAESKTNLITMTDETFFETLKHVRQNRYPRIFFTPSVGENFTNRNWDKYLQILLKEDYIKTIYMVTNGILLNKQRLELLLNLEKKEKLQLNFSLSMGGGDDKETYKFMFGVDKFETVKNNINNLFEELKNNNSDMPIYLHFRVPELKKFSFKEAKQIFNPTKYKKAFFRAIDEYESLNDLSQAKLKNLKIKATINEKLKQRKPCVSTKNPIYYSDGDVGLCGCVASRNLTKDRSKNDLIIGTIKDNESILLKRKNQIINDWKEKNIIPKMCQACQYYS